MTVYQKKLLVSGFWVSNVVLAYMEFGMVVDSILSAHLALSMMAFHVIPALVVSPMLLRASETPDPVPSVSTETTPQPAAPSRLTKYRAAVDEGNRVRMNAERDAKAVYDAATDEARPDVARWLEEVFAPALQQATRRKDTDITLNPGVGRDTYGLRDSVRVLLGCPESAFGSSDGFHRQQLFAGEFVQPRGRALIEALLTDGFAVSVDFYPITSVDDLRSYLSSGAYNRCLRVRWPHLSKHE